MPSNYLPLYLDLERSISLRIEKYFPLTFLYLFPGLFLKSFLYYREHKRDIYCIHAHGLVAAFIVKILNILFPRKRCIVSTHAVYNLTSRPLLAKLFKFVLNDFDAILAVSEISKRELTKIGLEEDRLKVHPNWIQTDRFIPLEKPDPQIIPNIKETFNVLFIGRLLEIKGVGLFLEAAQALPQIGFHVVGNGPLEEEVKSKMSVLKNLYYYGILNQNDPAEFKKLLTFLRCHFTHTSSKNEQSGPNVIPFF